MLRQFPCLVPVILAGVLVLQLIGAVTNNARGNWISVAIVALLLAVTLHRRPRTPDTKDRP